jgi:hypothetical protein
MRLLTLLLAAILTAYAALGSFQHFEADDYCHASDAYEYGVLGNVVHVWFTWNGRYAQNAVSPTLYLTLGERASQIVPALILAALVGAGYLVTRRWLIALAFTYALIAGLQNLWQVAYWVPGSVTYLLPLACLGALCYLLRRFAPPDSTKARRWLPVW